MKKILVYIGFVLVLAQVSCTKNFDAVNTDPTQATASSFDANLLLPSIQWNYANGNTGYNGPILFQSMWAQIFASTSSGAANYYDNADKYVQTTGTFSYVVGSWNTVYGAAGYANELQNLTKDNPELVNLNSYGTIMKVMSMQYLTDVYGDIPYSQALQAKTGVNNPVYDKQQDIYNSMLNDLDGAIAKLDAAKPLPTSDAFSYKGDIVKWKKLGYSLMLKLAMRLTKVDAATAQKYAEKAAAGGTLAGVADDAYLLADDPHGYTNGNASALAVAGDVYEVRWSKTYIDYLRTNNDPRLGVIAEVPNAGLAANQSDAPGSTDPAIQLGLPNGYDLKQGATDITKSPGYPGGTGAGADVTPIGKYSRPRSSLYRNRSGAIFILTYAESELLLAEAAVRGWNVGGTSAQQHYQNAVVGALQSLATLGADAMISAPVANAYAAAHPLDVSSPENSLKQINEQYWATDGSLLNFVEAWSNWRRSGYPQLVPVKYPGNFSGGQIPRREIYPVSESSLNPAAYKDAASRLTGGDTWSARVWWDK
ncbi:SusD/RagB family nutrient-binding outer membrane lipoprotein [Segetibacter koreensis]|uniref:SusD/RagB family nutrient-binding outer membrane lipoprotein n=1 Tax=Segetibacter koreensis TaxID=398037 RepID=UPI000361F0A5|nr:SusD/RagB family nutrient-binding outer membrane lipoprotein [Segetibacter koreensis]